MKQILLILAVISITACASFPPPKFENNVYTNYKYNFWIDIPDGWVRSEKIPDIIKNVFDEEIRYELGMAVLFLVNAQTNGVIIVKVEKTIFSPALFAIDPKATDKVLDKNYKNQKDTIDKFAPLQDYSYDCKGIWSCGSFINPCEIGEVKMLYKNNLKLVRKDFFYQCQEDDTCALSIGVMSPEVDFDKNFPVFTRMVDSLKSFKPEKP